MQPAKGVALVRPGDETRLPVHQASRRAALRAKGTPTVVVRDTVRECETLAERLAAAERRLVDAQTHVRRQRELIETLEREGLSVDAALITLVNLHTLVRLRLENRDRLRRELNKAS